MTKQKKAKISIKEANNMADMALLKTKIKGYISSGVEWLESDFKGHKRGKILFIAIVAVMVFAQIS